MVPWIADADPSPLAEGNRPNASPLCHKQAQRIGQLEFSPLRLPGLPYGREDRIVENVDSWVNASNTATSHLLVDRDNVSPLDYQAAKARRVFDLCSTHQ